MGSDSSSALTALYDATAQGLQVSIDGRSIGLTIITFPSRPHGDVLVVYLGTSMHAHPPHWATSLTCWNF